MYRNCYLFSILLFGVCNSYSQSYKYVEPGKEWQVYVNGVFHPPYTFTMQMRHDSILWAGKYYHPLVSVDENGKHLNTKYFREEDGKVYRKNSANDSELMVYNWKMMVGDTINKTEAFVDGYAIVDSVGLQIGTLRKKWYLTQYCDSTYHGNFEIIEGIGSNILEYEDQKCYVFETDSRVFCVRDDDQGHTIILDCFGHNNALVARKQWVTSHKDPISNLNTYTRYKLGRVGHEIENKWELLTTNNRQGDNNWASTNRVSNGIEYEVVNGKQYKLFDFTLQKGDTFKLEFPNEPKTYMVVDSTDYTILLDQREYKRLFLRSPLAPGKKFIWVDGVGDIDRFIYYRPSAYGTETIDYKLTCYYYSYNLHYRASNSSNCDLKSAVDESSSADIKLLFYPNPATDYLHIITDDELAIDIFSIMGQKIISEKVTLETDIDISMLEKGAYIISAINKQKDQKIHKVFFKL